MIRVERDRVARRGMAGALLLVVSLGACSGEGDTNASTTGVPQEATIEELDAAVGPAAHAILDADGFQATTVIVDADGRHNKTEWLDLRANGDHFALFAVRTAGADELGTLAIAQTGTERFCAAAGPGASCDTSAADTGRWILTDALVDDPSDVHPPVVALLKSMGSGDPGTGLPKEDATVTVSPDSRGGVVWTMASTIMGSMTLTEEWTIDSQGFLRSYSHTAESESIVASPSAMLYEFTPVDREPPIRQPEIGAPLDLSALDIPEDLPLPGK
ncbi:MAG: hypothetical protein GY926_17745 [bacterium]|nr:hypothetical protein [bacterium]